MRTGSKGKKEGTWIEAIHLADSQTAMFVGVAASLVAVVLAASTLRNRRGR